MAVKPETGWWGGGLNNDLVGSSSGVRVVRLAGPVCVRLRIY
jgi:hypothetical protein